MKLLKLKGLAATRDAHAARRLDDLGFLSVFAEM